MARRSGEFQLPRQSESFFLSRKRPARANPVKYPIAHHETEPPSRSALLVGPCSSRGRPGLLAKNPGCRSRLQSADADIGQSLENADQPVRASRPEAEVPNGDRRLLGQQ